jgi:hypothetical protein
LQVLQGLYITLLAFSSERYLKIDLAAYAAAQTNRLHQSSNHAPYSG